MTIRKVVIKSTNPRDAAIAEEILGQCTRQFQPTARTSPEELIGEYAVHGQIKIPEGLREIQEARRERDVSPDFEVCVL